MIKHTSSKMFGIALVFAGTLAFAQGGPGGQGGAPDSQPPLGPMQGQGGMRQGRMAGRGDMLPPQPGRPPMERAMHRWWNNPELAEKLGITADQKKKMDDIMQQHRLKLIDLNAGLQKAEAIMEPLIGADQPDEAKILAQIDRVAQARAELEKANARMLLGIRQVLTPEQWKKLQEERPRQGQGQGQGPGSRGPRTRPMQEQPPAPAQAPPQQQR